MQVRADNDFELFVDGVKWSPISFEDGSVNFVVSTSGRFSFQSAGKEIFFFRNEVVSDFTGNVVMTLYNGSEQVGFYPLAPIYRQFEIPAECNSITVGVLANGGSSVIRDLPRTINQGEIAIYGDTDTTITFSLRNFDSSSYIDFRIGNTLVCFGTPIV